MDEIEVDLTPSECKDKFIKLRRDFLNKMEKAGFKEKLDVFTDLFEDVSVKAALGDIVCQDFLAYLYKKGWEDILPVNIDTSMKWQLLAGANGNGFAIEKLSLFLNSAIDKILLVDDIAEIAEKNEIFQENYQFIIGRLICEAIVDELQINAKELIKEKLKTIEYDPKTLRVYDRARDQVLPRVLKFLRG